MTITITPEVEARATAVQSYREDYEIAESRYSDFKYKWCNRVAGVRPDGFDWDSPEMRTWSNLYDKAWTEAEAQQERYIRTYMSKRGHETDWEFIGEGCYRAAFRGPDGLVYKVGVASDNHTDARISRYLSKIKGKPRIFRFPEMHMVGDVLVTEMVESQECPLPWNETERAWDRMIRWAEKHGVKVQDCYGDNTLWDGKCWVFVDMGNWDDGSNPKFVNGSQSW